MHHSPRASRRRFMTGAIGLATLTASAGAVFAQAQPGTSPEKPFAGSRAKDTFSARSTDGTTLAGEAYGDPNGLEILFIHGLRQSRLSWEKQFADPSLAGLRLVSFDLRGHGDSDKPTSIGAYSDADRWVDDVAAVIAASKLRRPVLVGWSLGGFVVGAYLRKYGGTGIAGINLVDAVTKLSPDLLTEEAGTFARTATSHDLAERTLATAEFLAACFHRQPTAAQMQRMLVVNGMTERAVNEGFIRTQTADLEPVFRDFSGPILLTHGVYDRLVRVAMSERIKAIHANSQLSIYSESGHTPFVSVR